MELKKIIENVVSNSQFDNLPNELQPARLFKWDTDLSSDKDWDDFVGGQLVAHTYWDKSNIKGMIDVTNLTFGNTPTSFWGQLGYNEQITIYTSEYTDLTGKFISIGEDIEHKYFAISFELHNFKLGVDGKQKTFLGKIILVNIQRFLDNQFNDENEAPTINIANGKLNETITVPSFKKPNTKQPYDPIVKTIQEKQITIKKARRIEILLPKPAIQIGGGFDFISNDERKLNAPANKNRRINVNKASTKPNHFPINPYYCILPTQWNVPSIDNYGWTHPADRSNVIKTLMATQAIGNVAKTGVAGLGTSKVIGSLTQFIGSSVIGLGQKFFGDKGTLANSTAVNASFLSGESDPIKFFIQGDGATGKKITSNGYIELEGLKAQNDYLELNQANGQFGKYGKSMSPSQNEGFNRIDNYRALGLDSIEIRESSIPALATPWASSAYSNLKINDTKINDILKVGAPRLEGNSGNELKPFVFPETWDVYIRNMFFRPDPYSFWNWPCLMPAEIGVFDVEKKTSITYDTSAVDALVENLGIVNPTNTSSSRKRSYWNKTITVSQITENDLYDPNKTFSSFRFEFAEGTTDDLYQIHMCAITSSTMRVKILDENDQVIREHNFNSQGKNVGTSASWGTVVQL